MFHTIIVVPCFNEEGRFCAGEFSRFVDSTPGVDFLLVNDGSRDGTLGVLQSLRRQRPNRISVLNLEKNVGKAEAVRQGFLTAFSWQQDCVGFLDADLATPLAAIPQLRDVLQRRADIDIVIGARLPLQGRRIERRPIRRFLGGLFAAWASWILGVSIRDTQCGAKLFRSTAGAQRLFTDPFCSRWIFDVELLARRVRDLRATGQSTNSLVYELPLDDWREIAGSKLKSGDFVKAARELFQIYFKYLWMQPAAPALRTQSIPRPNATRRAA